MLVRDYPRRHSPPRPAQGQKGGKGGMPRAASAGRLRPAPQQDWHLSPDDYQRLRRAPARPPSVRGFEVVVRPGRHRESLEQFETIVAIYEAQVEALSNLGLRWRLLRSQADAFLYRAGPTQQRDATSAERTERLAVRMGYGAAVGTEPKLRLAASGTGGIGGGVLPALSRPASAHGRRSLALVGSAGAGGSLAIMELLPFSNAVGAVGGARAARDAPVRPLSAGSAHLPAHPPAQTDTTGGADTGLALRAAELRLDAAAVVAELRLSIAAMLRGLRAVANSGEGGSLEKLLSRYDLKLAITDASERPVQRGAPQLWARWNAVLKVASDFWRLPLPLASDPFGLRFFSTLHQCGEEADACAMLRADVWHSAVELKELEQLEAWLSQSVLGRLRTQALRTAELQLAASGGKGAEKGWSMVAYLLYGSTRAYAQRAVASAQRGLASSALAMAWRITRLQSRVVTRRLAKHTEVARIIQWHWREKQRADRAIAEVLTHTGETLDAYHARVDRARELAATARSRVDLLRRRREAVLLAAQRLPEYELGVLTVQVWVVCVCVLWLLAF
ncbi:hypothetical protein T492DRAFT_98341 [Pavlovales sp. CCMP2436]|nr:hypothetical protein T492DRAFT_98341 [Pavlovales sp. CCMP2436]